MATVKPDGVLAAVRPEVSTTWPVVLYRGARDNEPKARRWDWETMARGLARHRVWTGSKVDAPAWSPVTFQEGAERRRASLVASVSMLVLDCDAGEPLDTLEALGDDFVRLGHTSWSHTTEKPKARLVFPFHPSRPCPAHEWPEVWGAASRWAASQGVTVDAATKDPSRLYFGPYVPPDIVAKEEAEAWTYRDGSGTGLLPDRPRGYLSWARLVNDWPPAEDEGELADWAIPTPSAGSAHDSNERHDRRRRAFGSGLVASRARKLASAGKGGRNASLFGAARLVGQLEAAGAVDAGTALAELDQAARTAGLGPKEIRRTLASGYSAGRSDGPYDLEREMGQ